MIDEFKIKESFKKIKEDVFFLQQELVILKQEINQKFDEIKEILQKNMQDNAFNNKINRPDTSLAQDRHSTHNPAHNLVNYALKQQNFHSSIGNEGVPADRQQTDNRQINGLKQTFDSQNKERPGLTSDFPLSSQSSPSSSNRTSSPDSFKFSSPLSISNLLNNLKKDLGEKFKRLTKKEFLIFSVLYTLEEETGKVTYSDIAKRTGLTESSIRDYISRLVNKKIPIIKEKINNKLVILRISKELKDLATLDKLSRLHLK